MKTITKQTYSNCWNSSGWGDLPTVKIEVGVREEGGGVCDMLGVETREWEFIGTNWRDRDELEFVEWRTHCEGK